MNPSNRVTPFPTTVGQGLCTPGVQSSAGDGGGLPTGVQSLSTAGGDNGTGRTPAESHGGGQPLKDSLWEHSPRPTPQAASEPTLCDKLETPEPHPPQPHFPSPPWPGNLPHHTHPHPEPESGLSGVYTVTQLMGSYSSLGKGATKLRSWELCVFLWVLNFLNDAESQATGAQVQRAGGQR